MFLSENIQESFRCLSDRMNSTRYIYSYTYNNKAIAIEFNQNDTRNDNLLQTIISSLSVT